MSDLRDNIGKLVPCVSEGFLRSLTRDEFRFHYAEVNIRAFTPGKSSDTSA